MNRSQFDKVMESVHEHSSDVLEVLRDRLAAYYLDVDAQDIEPRDYLIEFEQIIKRHAKIVKAQSIEDAKSASTSMTVRAS